MKYIIPYSLFENNNENNDIDWSKLNREQKKGKLLHLYSSIPIQKEKAQIVIKSIVKDSGNNFNIHDKGTITPWKFGKNRIVKKKNKSKEEELKLHDKLRFNDYFNSLLVSKDIRGFNFEGLIAGLFNGWVQPAGSRADVILETGERCSVKFIDSKGEAPVLASLKSIMNDDILNRIGNRRIFDVFKTISKKEEDLRSKIFDMAFGDIDLFLIGYPDEQNEPSYIILHIVSNKEMKDAVCGGLVNAPKTSSNKWQLRISSSAYKTDDPIKIEIPKISDEDLDNLWDIGSREWSKEIFGNSISRRMRSDVIDDVMDNKEEIADNLEKDIQMSRIKKDENL